MNNVSRVIDIVGVALVLGLVLRYARPLGEFIATTAPHITEFTRAVSLQPLGGLQSTPAAR